MNHEHDTTQTETLISRYVDQTATPEDLAQLSQLARRDQTLWPRLQAAVDDHAAMVHAIEQRTRIVESIDLPELLGAESAFQALALTPSTPSSIWVRWGGWAVAATLVLAWIGLDQFAPRTTPIDPQNNASILHADWTSTDALNHYVELGTKEGRVLRELPKVLVRTQPSADGKGTDVIYLRQFIERATLSGLYNMQRDEQGQPGMVPVNWNNQAGKELY